MSEQPKMWKPWPGMECPDCGSSTEYLTEQTKDGWTDDCDPIRCADPKCQRHTLDLGHTIVHDDDDVNGVFESWPIGDDGKPHNPGEQALEIERLRGEVEVLCEKLHARCGKPTSPKYETWREWSLAEARKGGGK